MNKPQNKIKLFESQQVRTEWDAEGEKWWFSVLDIIAVLTDQPDYKKVRNYWKWLKNKLIAEGSQLVSVTNQLKLTAVDQHAAVFVHPQLMARAGHAFARAVVDECWMLHRMSFTWTDRARQKSATPAFAGARLGSWLSRIVSAA